MNQGQATQDPDSGLRLVAGKNQFHFSLQCCFHHPIPQFQWLAEHPGRSSSTTFGGPLRKCDSFTPILNQNQILIEKPSLCFFFLFHTFSLRIIGFEMWRRGMILSVNQNMSLTGRFSRTDMRRIIQDSSQNTRL